MNDKLLGLIVEQENNRMTKAEVGVGGVLSFGDCCKANCMLVKYGSRTVYVCFEASVNPL